MSEASENPVGPEPGVPFTWIGSVDNYIRHLEKQVEQQKEELRSARECNEKLTVLVRELSKGVIPERFLSLKDVKAQSEVGVAPMFDSYRYRITWPMPTECARSTWAVDIPMIWTKEHVENVYQSWHQVYRGDMLRNIGLGLDTLVERSLGELVQTLSKKRGG